ncbi:MAG TPA: ABC transporter ATP-binding protein [Streptosporangiaceae bacterium]|jgi:iron(III) transport system ATP-binding protein
MAHVTITGLTKAYDDGVTAVDDVDLTIADGEFLTLLGPSGCGKTTTLRCLAGLEEPTGGEITIGDNVVAAPGRGLFVPPERRGTGMVFQNYALWPHMSVKANVAYPVKLARTPRVDIDARVAEMLAAVGLGDKGDRLATQLSGGQQQRVALARAMANHPRLLLFDEPLSNLDAKLRASMRTEIRNLHREIGTTAVYVTHDQEEAMVLSDRIVVMSGGRIQQVGAPREIYTAPATRFVADFVGYENIIAGTVADRDGTRIAVRPTTGGPLIWAEADALPEGTEVEVAFRAAHLRIGTDATGANAFKGTVTESTYLGSRTDLVIDAGDGLLLRGYVDDADLIRMSGAAPSKGEPITVTLPPSHVTTLQEP